MEQPKSAGYFELDSKVATGQVVTLVINKNALPSYLIAASATGFKVEKIADGGEEFPLLNITDSGGLDNPKIEIRDGKLQQKVSKARVYGKGSIAVSIERPEGSKDHTPFWNNLRSLDQKKV